MSSHEFRIEIVGDGGGPNGGPAPTDPVRQPPNAIPPRPAWLPTARINPSQPNQPNQPPRPPRQPARSPWLALAGHVARAFNLRTVSSALYRYEQVQKAVQGIGKELQKNAKLQARMAKQSSPARSASGLTPAQELRRLMNGGIKSSLMQDIRANFAQFLHDVGKTRVGQFAGNVARRFRPARAAAAVQPPARPGGTARPAAGPGLLSRIGGFMARNPKAVAAGAAAGAMIAAAVAAGIALQKLTRSLNRAAERFKLLAPRTAMASAQAEVAQIRGDLGRARQLDGDLSRFIRAQSEISQILQNIKTDFQEVALKIMAPLAEHVARLLEFLEPALESMAQGIGSMIDRIGEILEWMRTHILPALRELLNIQKEEADRDRKDDLDVNALIDGFLNMDGPAPPMPAGGGLPPAGGGLPAGGA